VLGKDVRRDVSGGKFVPATHGRRQSVVPRVVEDNIRVVSIFCGFTAKRAANFQTVKPSEQTKLKQLQQEESVLCRTDNAYLFVLA
jgi:hypothetical protein